MDARCRNSSQGRSPGWGLVCLAAALAFAGCAGPVGTGAPRSNVSRENALRLAEITAASVGGEVFTVSATGSMKPTLDESSVVAVERVPFAALRQGDIVIYRTSNGLPVVHRLYEAEAGRWLVLGDNNGMVDREAVTETNFIGRVCAIFYTSSDSGASATTAFAQR